MPFQVTMFWDENVPHPAFVAREEAISYAIGLLAQLPEDANPNADVSVSNEDGFPGILDDASVMLSDFGIEKRLSESFELRQRAFFVDPYQAARARDIRRQNSRQSPLYVLAAHRSTPGLGEIEWLYSR
jgi:hypothetical protein